jgi:hypothetical protein
VSYVQSKVTGEVIPLRHRSGIWLIEVWVEKNPTNLVRGSGQRRGRGG